MVVGYGIKIFWPGLFITSPDHLVGIDREGAYAPLGTKKLGKSDTGGWGRGFG